jgi:hypothetical protein
MSQSDYIKFKKVSTELKINKFPPTFESSDYTSFIAYNLETSITNTKPSLDQLVPSSSQLIFGMKINVNYSLAASVPNMSDPNYLPFDCGCGVSYIDQNDCMCYAPPNTSRGCPRFIMCNNTNLRSNRLPNMGCQNNCGKSTRRICQLCHKYRLP